MRSFALTGVAGYVAPKHLAAIRDTGNRLLAALDPHDSVGVLDRYFFDARYFSDFERFDRYLESVRRSEAEGLDYLSICSPNHLHDAHVRLALRLGADAICEKPLVINPWNLDALEKLEAETGRAVFTVLQLRSHPTLIDLRERILAENASSHYVELTYVTARGLWYRHSWKGDPSKSGGLLCNIGIHFFDLLIWLFGSVESLEVEIADEDRSAGTLELERASVRWFLSIRADDLPFELLEGQRTTFRSISIDGREIDFTDGFSDLHTKVYEEILSGAGLRIPDARPSIELVHRLRSARPTGGSRSRSASPIERAGC